MKYLISYLNLIICFKYIYLKVEEEQNYFEIKITKILSDDIPIGGSLLLQTEGIALMIESKEFSLSITKEEDSHILFLALFTNLMKFYIMEKI